MELDELAWNIWARSPYIPKGSPLNPYYDELNTEGDLDIWYGWLAANAGSSWLPRLVELALAPPIEPWQREYGLDGWDSTIPEVFGAVAGTDPAAASDAVLNALSGSGEHAILYSSLGEVAGRVNPHGRGTPLSKNARELFARLLLSAKDQAERIAELNDDEAIALIDALGEGFHSPPAATILRDLRERRLESRPNVVAEIDLMLNHIAKSFPDPSARLG